MRSRWVPDRLRCAPASGMTVAEMEPSRVVARWRPPVAPAARRGPAPSPPLAGHPPDHPLFWDWGGALQKRDVNAAARVPSPRSAACGERVRVRGGFWDNANGDDVRSPFGRDDCNPAALIGSHGPGAAIARSATRTLMFVWTWVG